MIKPLLALALVLSPIVTQAQVSAPPAADTSTLPLSGAILKAYVVDVRVVTSSESGAYTAFLIKPPGETSRAWWFYVRNDDVAKSLERGAIIGLLMGAAEANRWSDADWPQHLVNIRYETVGNRRIITEAALGDRLGVPR